MKHLLAGIFSCLTALMLFAEPVFASINPNTGDPSERIMGWVFIALGVSLIVMIILFFVLGRNRRD